MPPQKQCASYHGSRGMKIKGPGGGYPLPPLDGRSVPKNQTEKSSWKGGVPPLPPLRTFSVTGDFEGFPNAKNEQISILAQNLSDIQKS